MRGAVRNPASLETLGWSDPPPLPQVTTPTGAPVNELGGAWSSYWFTKGLNVFRVSGPGRGVAIRLPHLNPQTQEFSTP